MKIGSIARDKEPKYDGLAVILNILENSAESIEIPGSGQTVAEANPTYNSECKVAEVSFINTIEGKMPTWWMMSESQFISEVESSKIKKYYYPIPRLEQVRNGLIDGVVVRVAGVADPFNHKEGSYAFEVSKLNTDISHNESHIVNEYDKVTKTTSTLTGIMEALKWVEKRGRNEGVQIVVEDNEVIRKIKGEYNVRDVTTRRLISNIKKISETVPKLEYREAPKGHNKNLNEKAIQKYKKSEEPENTNFEVDRVVDEEYIVDGIFSVNLDQNKCTCDANGSCDHIEAVEKKVMK